MKKPEHFKRFVRTNYVAAEGDILNVWRRSIKKVVKARVVRKSIPGFAFDPLVINYGDSEKEYKRIKGKNQPWDMLDDVEIDTLDLEERSFSYEVPQRIRTNYITPKIRKHVLIHNISNNTVRWRVVDLGKESVEHTTGFSSIREKQATDYGVHNALWAWMNKVVDKYEEQMNMSRETEPTCTKDPSLSEPKPQTGTLREILLQLDSVILGTPPNTGDLSKTVRFLDEELNIVRFEKARVNAFGKTLVRVGTNDGIDALVEACDVYHKVDLNEYEKKALKGFSKIFETHLMNTSDLTIRGIIKEILDKFTNLGLMKKEQDQKGRTYWKRTWAGEKMLSLFPKKQETSEEQK